MKKIKDNFNVNYIVGSGVCSAGTSARGSIGETNRVYCPHSDCYHAEDQEPTELKKIKKVENNKIKLDSHLRCYWFQEHFGKMILSIFSFFSNEYEWIGAKFFSWLVVSTTMETNCR